MVKEMEKKKEFYRQQAEDSRIERRGREEALCLINAAGRSGGGKKISTPLTFFPSDTKSSHGMDPLVTSQRIAQNDST